MIFRPESVREQQTGRNDRIILKAELHCHIEGAAAPELVVSQARKYDKDPSPYIQNGSFVWRDFTSFLAAYDFASDLFRTEDDYARLADYYLTSLARDGAIYSEVFTSPDHAKKAGLSPKAYTDALGEGMARAKAKTGIEGRMIVTGVRHLGVEAVERAARFAARCGHPLVTGFGMAGDERFGDIEDYVRAFEIAREAGLGITVHAGEADGPHSVWQALNGLGAERIGHAVHAPEDEVLMDTLAERQTGIEVSLTSNVQTTTVPDYASHPLRLFLQRGLCATLNSDDPGISRITLQHEYEVAAPAAGLDDQMIRQAQRNALTAAFFSPEERQKLAEQCAGRTNQG